MPPPQGLISFPGCRQILSGEVTLAHGITPGRASLEIDPQSRIERFEGDLTITYGDVRIVLPGFIVNAAER